MNELFNQWKQKSSEFTRLQWVYALVAAVALVLGGLISLIDSQAGMSVATFAFYAALLFVVNFVVSSVIATLIGPAKRPVARK